MCKMPVIKGFIKKTTKGTTGNADMLFRLDFTDVPDIYVGSRSPRPEGLRRSVRWEKGPLDLFLVPPPPPSAR